MNRHTIACQLRFIRTDMRADEWGPWTWQNYLVMKRIAKASTTNRNKFVFEHNGRRPYINELVM